MGDLIKRFKDRFPRAVCFLLGDFNPRTQSNNRQKWIKGPSKSSCFKRRKWSEDLTERINRLIKDYDPKRPKKFVRREANLNDLQEHEKTVLIRIWEGFMQNTNIIRNTR